MMKERVKVFLPNFDKYVNDSEVLKQVKDQPLIEGSIMTDISRLNSSFEQKSNCQDENRNLKEEISSLKYKIDEMIKQNELNYSHTQLALSLDNFALSSNPNGLKMNIIEIMSDMEKQLNP